MIKELRSLTPKEMQQLRALAKLRDKAGIADTCYKAAWELLWAKIKEEFPNFPHFWVEGETLFTWEEA